jgi:ABC-type branched-subunit amino acid transport system substrate-binding protein
VNPEQLLTELDGPRPLPPALYERIEQALLDHEHGAPVDVALLGALDAPRPLPLQTRARIERALMRQSPARQAAVHLRRPRAALAAATAVAVLAGIFIVARAPDRRAPSTPRAPEAAAASPAVEAPGGRAPLVTPGSSAAPAPRPKPRVGTGPGRQLAAGPLRVAVTGGDAAQEAGFRGYVTMLNAAGGVHGRRIEITAPSADAVVTVNLAVSPLASPPDGAVLETMAATQDVLTGRVFSFASPPERQAHLLASAVFPQSTPSGLAVVYRAAAGLFGDRVPRALREVLDARGVRVIEVVYEPGDVVPLVPASAVFLSLDQRGTLAFLDYADANGYRTPGVVACVFPMLDLAVVTKLAEGYLVLSPYSLGSPDDQRAIAHASGRPVSSATIHGWVTANALATALSRARADTPAGVLDAIRGLAGFDSGFAPAYQTRAGTNARTPEGILYEVRQGKFAARAGFQTDPF